MGILDDDVARVREATDLVALVSEHVALKRVGRRFQGLCPFHQEKTPSFSVSPDKGVWHCFGCQKSGDAITFVREVEHLDFVEAVERLAGARQHHAALRRRVVLRGAQAQAAAARQRCRPRSTSTTSACSRRPTAGIARRYLRSRGFDGDAVRKFSLGWAPDGYDPLSAHLQKAEVRARRTSSTPGSRS